MYVSDYITKTTLKTHTIFDTVRSTFKKHGEILNGNQPMKEKARSFMTKVVNQLSAKAEMGAPLICLYLLGNPDHYTSHIFVVFYWRPYVVEARRAFNEADREDIQKLVILKSRGKLIGCSWVHDYIFRSPELAHVNLYEFIRTYERVRILGKSKRETDETSCGLTALEPIIDEYSDEICYIKNNKMRVPNFVSSLPRADKGDIEYYSSTMLVLFKPWRSGHDLRSSCHQSWKAAFDTHTFSPAEKRLMVNFNIKFECMDARDDYRAQMKKGAASHDIIGSWDATAYEGTELPPQDALPSDSAIYDQSYDEHILLKEGRKYTNKLNDIRKITTTFCSVGWAESKGTGYAATPESVTPSIIYTGSQWQEAVDSCKCDLLEKKRENLLGPSSSNAEKSNDSNCSFLPNRVRIIDKSYFLKKFKAHGKHMTTLVNDSIERFTLNEEQTRAFRIIANHALAYDHEQLNMYIGGMGGTGKSQVLKALSHFFEARSEAHRFTIVAPTGSAAALLGGGT
ncbi:hypothetical protein BJ165DRAFT_1342536, partial [Panaeolus papilionaceus]